MIRISKRCRVICYKWQTREIRRTMPKMVFGISNPVGHDRELAGDAVGSMTFRIVGGALMLSELVPSGIGLLTNWTHVRFLARVRSLVSDERARPGKADGTGVAHERSLSGMRPFVDDESSRSLVGLVALVADVLFDFSRAARNASV